MVLYHFSEEPDIRVFEPRSPIERPEVEPLVWAIDEWHQAMYFVPRDCPRACFWPGTTDDGRGPRAVVRRDRRADGDRGGAGWLERIRETVLYRYEMPEATFVLNDETAGHYVSREAVTPLSVEPVGDLLTAMAAASVELRVTPSLVELWRRVIRSTLCFSGTRLRNAAGYDPALFVQS